MTDRTARTLANVLLGAAVVGVGWYLFRTPRLGRLAWGLARTAVTTAVPAFLARETRTAWNESGRRVP